MSALSACRVCLASDREMYRLADTALKETYERVTSGTLCVEGRPCCLCGVCLSALRRCRRFIDSAREANDALDRWIRNQPDSLKLSERPLFSLIQTPTELFNTPNWEFEIKQEKNTTENEDNHEVYVRNELPLDDEGNILAEEIKYEVTGDDGNDNTFDSDDDNVETQILDNIDGHSSLHLSNFECVNLYEDMVNPKNDAQNVKIEFSEFLDKETAPGTSNDGRNQPASKPDMVSIGRSRKRVKQCEDDKTKETDHITPPTPAAQQCNITSTKQKQSEQHADDKLFLCGGSMLKRRRPITSEHRPENTDTPAARHIEGHILARPQKSKNQKLLNPHLKTEKKEKLYSCDKCNFKSVYMTNLKHHSFTHTGEKPFACDKCDYKCRLKAHLKQHNFVRHTNEKPFSCDQCDNNFSLKANLNRHLLTHSVEKGFLCDKCDFKANSETVLKRHKTTHTDYKPYTCDTCDKRFRRKDHLKRHSMVHTGATDSAVALLSCQQCNYKTDKVKLLNTHIINKHTGKNSQQIFSCDKCKFKSIYRTNFKHHLIIHTGEKPFACDKCDYKCGLKAHLKQHNFVRHSNKKPFSCEQCDFKCALRGNLNQHLLTHSAQKAALCDKCDYKANSEALLKRHLLTHSDDKPYACDTCEKKFRRKDHLNRHLMIHTGEKPYACDKCDYRSNEKQMLQRHLMWHANEKLFECNRCDYKCYRKSVLRQHLMTHTGDMPFACDECDFRSNYKHHLKRHLLGHTGVKQFACEKCDYKSNRKEFLKLHLKKHFD